MAWLAVELETFEPVLEACITLGGSSSKAGSVCGTCGVSAAAWQLSIWPLGQEVIARWCPVVLVDFAWGLFCYHVYQYSCSSTQLYTMQPRSALCCCMFVHQMVWVCMYDSYCPWSGIARMCEQGFVWLFVCPEHTPVLVLHTLAHTQACVCSSLCC